MICIYCREHPGSSVALGGSELLFCFRGHRRGSEPLTPQNHPWHSHGAAIFIILILHKINKQNDIIGSNDLMHPGTESITWQGLQKQQSSLSTVSRANFPYKWVSHQPKHLTEGMCPSTGSPWKTGVLYMCAIPNLTSL